MQKCGLCNKKIETTFLGKIKGTYVNKKPICSECQKDLPKKKEEILSQIK